jgi:peptidoglycan/LPS O-acetylase OafA/YrhL
MLSSEKYIKNRIFGLDLIRAVSVTAVLVAHTGYARIFGFRFGVIAVEYFFVLSGFLVGEMLLVECASGSDRKKILNFMIKRWFRTLPLYYLILLSKFFIQTPFLGMKVVPYLLFLQSNFGGITFFPVSWTIVIEEWFYLLLPMLIYIFFKTGITKKKFIIFSIALVLIENGARFVMAYYFHRNWGGIVGNFPFRFDSFFIGVFLAFVKLNYQSIYKKMCELKFFIPALLATLLVIILYAKGRGGEPDESENLWVHTVGFFLVSFMLALLVPFFEQSKTINGLDKKNYFKLVITWISLLSYPVYLIHSDILIYFEQHLHMSRLPFIIVSYTVILSISVLLFLFFHYPVTNLRKKFLIK